MHVEIIVEDQSGKKALDILVPKIVGDGHTFAVRAYRGIGHIPKNMRDTRNARKRILLDCLPKLLKGFGRTHARYPDDFPAAVVLVCDLDDKCLKSFRAELNAILNACHPQPKTRFCFAIEEGEAWFLGDLAAIKSAYPAAKSEVLDTYVQDSICGTWELLADAVFPGGAEALLSKGWQVVGTEKSRWAKAISPVMHVETNDSPSFQYFRAKLCELTTGEDL